MSATTDHTYGSASLDFEQMQVLIDTIAAECLRQSDEIAEQRAKLDAAETNVKKWRGILRLLQDQVNAGTLSLETVSTLTHQRNFSASGIAGAIHELGRPKVGAA